LPRTSKTDNRGEGPKRAEKGHERRNEHPRGVGDATGNSSGTKWVAFSAIAEHLDHVRRYTSRTNEIKRSFEDAKLKQRALEVVLAA
jgi:hypothetical protein